MLEHFPLAIPEFVRSRTCRCSTEKVFLKNTTSFVRALEERLLLKCLPTKQLLEITSSYGVCERLYEVLAEQAYSLVIECNKVECSISSLKSCVSFGTF